MQLKQPDRLIERLKEMQEGIREAILQRRNSATIEELAQVIESTESDLKYDIDVPAEEQIVEYCRRWAREDGRTFVLVAEGISETPGGPERIVFPEGAAESAAEFVLITDPVDGSRELMYDKRSAWSLAGIAPYDRDGSTLADIEIAVQSELPVSKQTIVDTYIATAEMPSICERLDLNTGKLVSKFHPLPSRARSIEQGFLTIAKFFPGGKEVFAAIEEALAERLVGPIRKGRASIFDDEYISTGGQLAELMAGHDRFIADIRPLMSPWLRSQGIELGLCAHPYDLATELIARQAGVIVTKPDGRPLDAPLDTMTNVSWVGYANQHLRQLIEPHLQELLAKHLVPGKQPVELQKEPIGLPERHD